METNAIRNQLVTLFALKNDGSNSITTLLYTMIILNVIDGIMKAIPIITDFVKTYFKNKFEKAIPIAKITSSEVKSRITFERVYDNSSSDNISDALLWYICDQDQTIDLFYKDFFIANKDDTFKITEDIKFKILHKNFSKEGSLTDIRFQIFSETMVLSKLRKWCNDIHKSYEINKKNKFGNRRFFFDELISRSFFGDAKPPFLTFTMTEFSTNKSLKNIYGREFKVVKERINMFVNNPMWYENKGIPHTLGILLHGPPGTGKTSTIKAIANDTKRHIFNIKLRENSTPEQLNDLFYNEVVKIKAGSNIESIIIPLNQRIYVIEDVDCLSRVVLDRELLAKQVEQEEEEKKRKEEELKKSGMMTKDQIFDNGMLKKQAESEKTLTLSYLLNLFDGILETPGRILIMTSNYPERLDKALIRPGRIDINIKLGNCNSETMKEMFHAFYDLDSKGEESMYDFATIDCEITPAKMQAILCNNINSPEIAYKELCEYNSKNNVTPPSELSETAVEITNTTGILVEEGVEEKEKEDKLEKEEKEKEGEEQVQPRRRTVVNSKV